MTFEKSPSAQSKFIADSSCPHCGRASSYTRVKGESDAINNDSIAFRESGFPFTFPFYIVFSIYECDNCGHNRLAVERIKRELDGVREQTLLEYPYNTLGTTNLTGVPSTVREDLEEGVRCLLEANAPKGAIVNFRRSLQAAVLLLGGAGKDLYTQIDDLYNKEIIRGKTRELAHKVRAFGKYGAHPLEISRGKDGPVTPDEFGQLTSDDAKYALESLVLFLEDAFVFPNKTAEVDKRLGELRNGREIEN